MSKTILVTGAASGFGRGTAIELAKKGHRVIASVEIEPQKTTLLQDAKKAGVKLEVIVLDITKESDRQAAFKYEIDVLMNNAGVMQSGPVVDIPMENVRLNYEVNVFGTLAMAQGFLPQMVKRGHGKIVFTTSMGGLISVPLVSVYTSTKHALEGLVEGMKADLAGTGVEVCTVNPGGFATGFNDRGAETMRNWFNKDQSIAGESMKANAEGMLALLENNDIPDQLDPKIMIDGMVEVALEDNSKFRNVIPEAIVPWIKAMQETAWVAKKDDSLWIDPSA